MDGADLVVVVGLDHHLGNEDHLLGNEDLPGKGVVRPDMAPHLLGKEDHPDDHLGNEDHQGVGMVVMEEGGTITAHVDEGVVVVVDVVVADVVAEVVVVDVDVDLVVDMDVVDTDDLNHTVVVVVGVVMVVMVGFSYCVYWNALINLTSNNNCSGPRHRYSYEV